MQHAYGSLPQNRIQQIPRTVREQQEEEPMYFQDQNPHLGTATEDVDSATVQMTAEQNRH